MDEFLKNLKLYTEVKKQAKEKGFNCIIIHTYNEGKREFLYCYSSSMHSRLKDLGDSVEGFILLNKEGTEMEFSRNI